MLRFGLAPRTFHFRTPAATSRGLLHERRLLLVEVASDASPHHMGRGEAGPIPGLSLDDRPDWENAAGTVIETLNGARLSLPDAHSPPLDAVTTLLAPFEERLAPWPSLRFGIEGALLTLLAGKAPFPSAFTRGEAPLPTHGLLWMEEIDGLRAQAAAKVAAGFPVLKLKIGALPRAAEMALLHELRAAYPHVALRLDANGAFTSPEAAALLEELAPLHIDFIEQPIAPNQHADLEHLARTSPVPLALDEEFIALAHTQRVDLLERLSAVALHAPVAILKPALLGGLAPTAALADQCDRLGLPWIVNSLLEAAPGHSIICQWTAARLEHQPPHLRRIHALGNGALFRDNLPSPIALEGCVLRWTGPTHANA